MTELRSPRLCLYRNGNYHVALYADGTKIKYTSGDCFVARFPDSIDLKITDFCDMACPMCHEGSSEHGRHGDLSAPFLSFLRAGTELAIGGGNALSHPQLDEFLQRMKARGVICNLTVNETHFLRERERIEKLLTDKLVYGLGISVNACDPETTEFARSRGNVILHLICGIADEPVFSALADKGLKILLLGYKRFGRGVSYYSENVKQKLAWLERNIIGLSARFDTVCFDNAALIQLKIKEKLPRGLYDERYMGDDGDASMYIDLVDKNFAVSSATEARYPLEQDIEIMFGKVKKS